MALIGVQELHQSNLVIPFNWSTRLTPPHLHVVTSYLPVKRLLNMGQDYYYYVGDLLSSIN